MRSLRLLLVSSLLFFGIGCQTDDGSDPISPDDCVTGTEGCACGTGDACDAGLRCGGGQCVRADGSGGGGGDPDPVDPCADDPCLNGRCDRHASGYTCSCDAGWMGVHCDDAVERGCDDSPCEHGSCTNLPGGDYSCACESGWSGPNCDHDIDDCASAPCANGTCTDGVDMYTCDPCENGTCIDDLNGYLCSCEAGWTGELCEQPVSGCADSPCAEGTCEDTGPGTYECTCEDGWDGEHCDTCATDYILEQGACIAQKQVACTTQGIPANATPILAEVTITYTSAAGWTAPAACAFTCHDGWEGDDCSKSIDDCLDHTCQNGSTCIDGHLGHTCSCPPGFTGELCETNVDDCADAPCEHGTCTDGVDSYSCSCNPGWDGEHCDTCAADYILEHDACINEKLVACTDDAPENATSIPGSVTITYTTAEGWTTPAACAFTCHDGWEGDDCGQSIDDCLGQACQNGSTCVDGHQAYSCTCLPGYEGPFCEVDIDDCADAPCVHGTCTDGVDSYSCNCNSGWDGAHCNTCAVDYDPFGDDCINQLQVQCLDESPENATPILTQVTITFTTADGWTIPASCAFTCDEGWEGDACDVPSSCSCPGTEVCDGEGVCYEPGLIDDFRTCDRAIYEAEGRHGEWYFFRGSGVSCSGTCEDVSVPPWGTECGAWITGGLAGGEVYAGMGLGLDADGPLYDACAYGGIEVTYSSDQAVTFYAKWNDVGPAAIHTPVTLPATDGISTATVDLTSFAGLDCSKLTELQFEPTNIGAGFGIAVYEVRFTGAEPCTDGALRCGTAGALEACVAGEWTSSSCAEGQHCAGNRCVDDDTTPVDVHGHLSVSGTHLVDQFGQPVQLKGVSSHWLNWADDGYQLNLSALEWMRDHWNLSVFRAAMGTEEEGGYLHSEEGRNDMLFQVETIIANAVAAGVYVIVDWHSHHAHDQTAEAVAFFADIAQRYGYLPNVLFEVYNEPLDVDWGSVLKPYHEALVSAIRAADSDDNDNVIILGTPNWDQDVHVVIPTSARVAGTNLMYALHFYSCGHGDGLRSNAQATLAAGVPLFVSEWGATDPDGGVNGTPVCAASADAWHSWMNANHISWAAWKLDDCDWEIDNRGVADTSCLLAQGAPLDGGWTHQWLNGHGPYVASKMQE